jgi:hypothetical protein
VVSAAPRESIDVAVTRERMMELAAAHGGDFIGSGGFITVGLGE